jgi:23S rRNA (cytosine1962-C5)-methyltransferase
MEYKLLDTGNGRRLEQVGKYKLVRPALNAFWPPTLSASEWDSADGEFTRDSSGGGKWSWKRDVPKSWSVQLAGLTILIKPTDFGHLGFFAEQYQNWAWQQEQIKNFPTGASRKMLNMFAYSGLGSLSMSRAGGDVCHLDAAKGMIEWGQENLKLNKDIKPNIRWITDDVGKFVAREQRRGNKYQGIIMDPPTFGRGPKGQLWKIDEHLNDLLFDCKKIMDLSQPHLFVLSCHSPGFTPSVLKRVLNYVFPYAEVESGEMGIPESIEGKFLPAGCYARFSAKHS